MQQSIGFSLFYAFGIVVGVIVALTELFPSEFLLVVGLTHLLLLVVWGLLLLPRSLKQAAGERVQTAGYLHTLIGFAAALLSLDRGDVELSAVLYPLGSALSTSIIGWLLGGEIASLGVNPDRRSLDSEYQQMAREMADFSEALRQSHHMYLSTIERATDAYRELHVQQIDLLRQHQQLQNKLIGDSEGAYSRLAETQGQLGDRLNALFAKSIVRLGDLSTSFDLAAQQFQHLETHIAEAPPSATRLQQNDAVERVSPNPTNITEAFPESATAWGDRAPDRQSEPTLQRPQQDGD